MRPKPHLKMLDHFGNPNNKQVNYKYPAEHIFAQMPSSITLTSIEFSTFSKGMWAGISGIKCRYSNQQESPLFQNRDGDELYHT